MSRTPRSGRDHPPAGARVRSRRGWFFAVAAVAAALVAVVVLWPRDQGGGSSVEQVGRAYVDALRAGDREALLRLVPPSFDATAAVDEKLRAAASVRDEQLSLNYEAHPVTPDIVIAHVRSASGRFSDDIAIQRFGNRWYVAIGRAPEPSDAPPTARPSL